eukprot:CAMPEP_0178411726 /NCGR_PEP_ID=MMETSP0689_2-20121128/21642_1 /TAXON_ID=160604 /ORGANISM="Amphidinium massartii, Strain CS-259" /LENGTH=324 /DNA_ID=CAMNT_0020032939 /DNA_START=5 /DNA_END=979 /DNA_ORIENTATION=+
MADAPLDQPTSVASPRSPLSPRMPLSPRAPVSTYVQEEVALVQKYENQTVKPFFIIDADWFKRWAKFVKDEGPRPGPITNSRLLQAGGKAKLGLKAAKDYRGVCEPVWDMLLDHYGGGPQIRCNFLDIYRPDVKVVPTSGAKGTIEDRTDVKRASVRSAFPPRLARSSSNLDVPPMRRAATVGAPATSAADQQEGQEAGTARPNMARSASGTSQKSPQGSPVLLGSLGLSSFTTRMLNMFSTGSNQGGPNSPQRSQDRAAKIHQWAHSSVFGADLDAGIGKVMTASSSVKKVEVQVVAPAEEETVVDVDAAPMAPTPSKRTILV